MIIDAATWVGLLTVLAVYLSYLAMLFLLRRFTYRTWLFHLPVLAGMALALAGMVAGGSREVGLVTLALGALWFIITWRELGIAGSGGLRVRIGDPMPVFAAVTTDGHTLTEQDLIAHAPALLVLYRGWWCPSSKAQLDELSSHYMELAALGLAIYAASVDGPLESAPMQDHVGSRITILCSVDDSFLDMIGVGDQRGAPWYDRLWFGASQRPIAMPAAIAIDRSGRISYASRSTRVDDRPRPTALIATLKAAAASDK